MKHQMIQQLTSEKAMTVQQGCQLLGVSAVQDGMPPGGEFVSLKRFAVRGFDCAVCSKRLVDAMAAVVCARS